MFSKSCARSCARATNHPGGLYLDWREASQAAATAPRAARGRARICDTEVAKARADDLAAKFAGIDATERTAPVTIHWLVDTYNREVTPTKASPSSNTIGMPDESGSHFSTLSRSGLAARHDHRLRWIALTGTGSWNGVGRGRSRTPRRCATGRSNTI